MPSLRCAAAARLRQTAAACLALAGLWSATSPAAALDEAQLLGLSRSVLRIEAPLPRGGFSMGSAVALGPDTVVTNCHVTRQASRISVVRGGVRHDATGQLADLDHDLCLLQVPGLGATPVALGAATALRVGQPVAALGFTGGVGMQRSQGEVQSLHRLDGAPVIRSSTWFNSGASGGALFDDQGALVGLLTFRLRGGLAHYFAAPTEWIETLQAQAAQAGYRPVGPLPAAGLPYWQLPNADQPRFLQAASLQAAQRWGPLADLARGWLRDDPQNPEAWHLLAEVMGHTGTAQQADMAAACARQLEARHPEVRHPEAHHTQASGQPAPAAAASHPPGPSAGPVDPSMPPCPLST